VLLPILIFGLFVFALRRVGFAAVFPRHRSWRWIGLAATVPLIGLAIVEIGIALQTRPMNDAVAALSKAESEEIQLVRDLNMGVNDVLSPGFPMGIPVRIRNYWVERQRLAEARITLEQVKVVASARPGASEKSVVVLVIGESASSSHWGVNGYPRDTTPRMSALSDAISLKNVVTPWAATRLSVPVILTGQQDPKTGFSPLTAPSVIAAFRAAGWKTFWLSNQSPLGQHDSAIALYAGQADITRYFNAVDYSKAADTDDILLEPVLKALKYDPAPRKLLVLHLLGSHARYYLRYPDEFDRFLPSGRDGARDDEVTTVNSYDNSILFTDHLLGEVIHFLQKQPSTVDASLLYVSDHGQALATSQCKQWGHNQLAESSYRVPGLVWLSEEAQRRHPDRLSQLKALREMPLQTREVFDTLLDLGDIDFSGAQLSHSWVNPAWKPEKRVFNGKSDFDSIAAEGPCRLLNSAGSSF
jgi:glucan phosphoethanolaminetransferase (alkaline phosphatase superfamily)